MKELVLQELQVYVGELVVLWPGLVWRLERGLDRSRNILLGMTRGENL